jgi:hypothetical protein
MVQICDPAHPFASLTYTVNSKISHDVGVPLKTPSWLKLSPGGNVELFAVNLYGALPPVAVSVWLYASPNAPSGSVSGQIVRLGQDTIVMA